MATVRRSRTLPATPDELWRIVGDAHHLPRWWPRVSRVENVDEDAFTEVLETDKGRPVRADYRVEASVAPKFRRWSLATADTPFEHFLRRSEIEVRLDPLGRETRVTLVLVQRARGLSRLGSPLLRKAARRQLDDALDGLDALVAPEG